MKMRIPSRFIRVAPQQHTVALRGKGGRFKGRRPVEGKGDTTNARYLIHDIDLNKNGKIDPREHGGAIQGRTEKIKVKASNRARGYERRV